MPTRRNVPLSSIPLVPELADVLATLSPSMQPHLARVLRSDAGQRCVAALSVLDAAALPAMRDIIIRVWADSLGAHVPVPPRALASQDVTSLAAYRDARKGAPR